MNVNRPAWAISPQTEIPCHLPSLCTCGQELDVCHGTHCPRCGTTVVLTSKKDLVFA